MKITRFLLAGAMMAGLVAATAPAHADDYLTVQSFDGTTIAFHWFPAQGLAPGQTAPTVLQGPGFGGKGQSNPDAPSGGGIPGVGPLRQAGYNVLTWNPRGISPSGGKAQLDNPNFEGRDVQALVNWVATQPEAQLDAPGDPRVGMTGGSYGGGIQFSTAAIDSRIDAIVPVIAWHSLGTALYKASTIKTAWVNLLMTGATQPGNTFDPKILKGRKEAKRGMTFSPEVLDFAKSAGPDAYLSQITAPTLIIQGTIDNLFPLSEAIQNYQALSANGVPVKMIWYCGGHGICLTDNADTTVPLQQTWNWLDKYLKGNAATDTGPAFTWVDQNGKWRNAGGYPAATTSLQARGKGSLKLVKKDGSGPYPGKLPSSVSPLTALLLRSALPSPTKNSVSVPLRAKKPTVVVGEPTLRLTYKGQAKRTKIRVLAQIVDNRNKLILGNEITPIPLKLNGKTQKVKLPLEAVSASLSKGQKLTLQIVGQSSIYDVFPQGSVRFSRVKISLPTL